MGSPRAVFRIRGRRRKAKKGETNFQPPIDPVLLAMTLGASFVARSFSGDRQQWCVIRRGSGIRLRPLDVLLALRDFQ